MVENQFKASKTFTLRKEEAITMRERYQDRVPVIIERSKFSRNLPIIDKFKYLVPNDLTVFHLQHIIRKRMKLKEHDALFLYCGNSLLKSDQLVVNTYDRLKEPDGFLYITYAQETVFGTIHQLDSGISRDSEITSYDTSRLLIEQ